MHTSWTGFCNENHQDSNLQLKLQNKAKYIASHYLVIESVSVVADSTINTPK